MPKIVLINNERLKQAVAIKYRFLIFDIPLKVVLLSPPLSRICAKLRSTSIPRRLSKALPSLLLTDEWAN